MVHRETIIVHCGCIQHISGHAITEIISSLLQFTINTKPDSSIYPSCVLNGQEIGESGENPTEEKERGQRASTLPCRFTDLS